MNSFFDDMDLLMTMLELSEIEEVDFNESSEVVKFSVEEDWEDFINE